MFLESFKITSQAIVQLVLLGAFGFWLVKRAVISEDGLKCLSDLVIGLFLPCFMFSEIIKRFSFSLYPDWWLFPLYSFSITAIGFVFGLFVIYFDKSVRKDQEEFLGVVTFQNSGYLPLPLVASLLPLAQAQEMFIYIFLFLLGFNMTIFSFGFLLLGPKNREGRFDFKNIFNAPVIATVLALAFVYFKINTVLPAVIEKPVELLGVCAIPLSVLVVGGNLASLKKKTISNLKPISYALVIKLIILPLVFLGFIALLKPRPLVGLLLLLQAAMPPAALLSVISKSQNRSDRLINDGIFYGHLISILTIPLFLMLFWMVAGRPY